MKKLTVLAVSLFTLFVASCSQKEENPVVQKQNPGINALQTEGGCEGGEDEDPMPMLAGKVVDINGQPIAKACVAVMDANGTEIMVTGTNASGHFFFNVLPEGCRALHVHRYGYQDTLVAVSGYPGERIVIVLQP